MVQIETSEPTPGKAGSMVANPNPVFYTVWVDAPISLLLFKAVDYICMSIISPVLTHWRLHMSCLMLTLTASATMADTVMLTRS